MRVGIEQHTQQRIVSGCRVRFDTRTTAEAHATRSPVSHKPAKVRKLKGFKASDKQDAGK
jgi:hypothetical protein